MGKPLPSLSTATEDFTPCELSLPLPAPKDPPRGRFEWDERTPTDKIKEALLRWLDEEL